MSNQASAVKMRILLNEKKNRKMFFFIHFRTLQNFWDEIKWATFGGEEGGLLSRTDVVLYSVHGYFTVRHFAVGQFVVRKKC